MTCKTPHLWYAFNDAKLLSVIDFTALRGWLFETENGKRRLDNLPQGTQGRYEQKNMSIGRLLPFASIPKETLICGYKIIDGEAVKITREEFLATLPAFREKKFYGRRNQSRH